MVRREEIEQEELIVLVEDECHLVWGDVCGLVWGEAQYPYRGAHDE